LTPLRIDKQLAALGEAGSLIRRKISFDQVKKEGAVLIDDTYPLQAGATEATDERYIFVEALGLGEETREVKIHLESGDPEDFTKPDVDVVFSVGFFDFPMTRFKPIPIWLLAVGVSVFHGSACGAEADEATKESALLEEAPAGSAAAEGSEADSANGTATDTGAPATPAAVQASLQKGSSAPAGCAAAHDGTVMRTSAPFWRIAPFPCPDFGTLLVRCLLEALPRGVERHALARLGPTGTTVAPLFGTSGPGA
jgi:hypothetical protein